MGIIDDFRNILLRRQEAGQSLNSLVTEAGADYASIHK